MEKLIDCIDLLLRVASRMFMWSHFDIYQLAWRDSLIVFWLADDNIYWNYQLNGLQFMTSILCIAFLAQW